MVSNTLMHLTTQAEQLMALQCANRHLRVDGLLLIDLFNPDVAYLESIAGIQELADWWEDDESGAQVLKWTTRYLDAARQLQETIFVYEEIFADGRNAQTRLSFPLRFWWPDEGALLLEQAGFAVDELYGDFDGSPYHPDSERLTSPSCGRTVESWRCNVPIAICAWTVCCATGSICSTRT